MPLYIEGSGFGQLDACQLQLLDILGTDQKYIQYVPAGNDRCEVRYYTGTRTTAAGYLVSALCDDPVTKIVIWPRQQDFYMGHTLCETGVIVDPA